MHYGPVLVGVLGPDGSVVTYLCYTQNFSLSVLVRWNENVGTRLSIREVQVDILF